MFFRRRALREQVDHFLFVGLGNPGREYAQTRHNIGFLVIDRLAQHWNTRVEKYKYKSLMGEYRNDGYRATLVKPQTFMNNSGQAVRSFFNFYKPPLSQTMVIFDDLDIPFGTIRIRHEGGSGGQKGMKSIIEYLGTEGFPRMRVGVGRPPGKMDSADFILDKFRPAEQVDLDIILNYCVDAIEEFINDGIEKAMTSFNKNILDGKP
ncbi:MAG: aminoacyl-tRNA hydrolase [Chloroflexi bacterium]|nr:aminoacyl-tRNA hydrolase [Chloroflexota bacterium]